MAPGPTGKGWKKGPPSAAEAQLLDDFGVFLKAMTLEVIQEFTAAAGHLNETAAGVEVLPVGAEVLGEVGDACGEQRDLDLGGAGVAVVSFIRLDNLLFINDFGHAGDRIARPLGSRGSGTAKPARRRFRRWNP